MIAFLIRRKKLKCESSSCVDRLVTSKVSSSVTCNVGYLQGYFKLNGSGISLVATKFLEKNKMYSYVLNYNSQIFDLYKIESKDIFQ